MYNEDSKKSVESSLFSRYFRKPLYDSFCFARIPSTIRYLLTGEDKEQALPESCFFDDRYDAVVLFFIDAFGSVFSDRYFDHPFLKRFAEKGIVSKITSQFPSTTAAHVTTIHTGLPVGISGIYEWFQYEPQVRDVIAPLLFSRAGDGMPGSLLSSGVPLEDFFPFSTLYEELHKKEVRSFLFQESSIDGTPYSQAIGKGASPFGYLSLAQGLRGLQELLMSPNNEKIYAFFYHSHIDSVGHRKGVGHRSFDASILYCLDRLESELAQVLSSSRKIAILLTADHGMVSVEPKKTIYINEIFPEILPDLAVPLPAGSCRDLFLSVREEALPGTKHRLEEGLRGRAEVFCTKDLIEEGLFGRVSDRFRDRVGNLVILPYENEGVWWREKGRFEQHFYASHGGLLPSETDIPFLFLSTK